MKRAMLLAAALCVAGCTASKTTTQHKAFYPGGTLRWEQELVGGVPHGRSETFHENGTLKSSGTYHRGSKRGYFVFYFDDGLMEKQLLVLDDTVLWVSFDPKQRPPTELLAYIKSVGNETIETSAQADDDDSSAAEAPLSKLWRATARAFEEGAPSSRFASLERISGTTDLGITLGAGGADDSGSISRLSTYGHYNLDGIRSHHVGIYADFTTSRLSTMEGSNEGRRTLEVAGTHRRAAAGGIFSSRLGVLAPMGNDTQFGAAIASASSVQRPTDSVGAMPSTVALRGGTSWIKTGSFWVFQGDAYLDLAVGGASDAVRPLGRLNGALGLGGKSAMLALEVVNTFRLDESRQSLRAVGASFRVQFSSFAASLLVSRATGDRDSITGGISREL